ncbi:MAG: hypothetical protein OTJ97_05080 [SAR202 cluster bacterium]|nr:hypothetical protein [SAR202 cluster bacterium]
MTNGKIYSPGVVLEPIVSRPDLSPSISRTAYFISSARAKIRLV